jgi:hypothetical protein
MAKGNSQIDCPIYNDRRVCEMFGLGIEWHFRAFGAIVPRALSGFLTLFDPGWSLLHLRNFCADKGKIFSEQDWYNDEAFANLAEKPRYRQIRLEAVDGSFNKSFDDRQRLLPPNEEVPSARVVCMGMVIHFLLSGQRLFERVVVRCADTTSVGRRVCVGNFGSGGFRFYKPWDKRGSDRLGLASSRKFCNLPLEAV